MTPQAILDGVRGVLHRHLAVEAPLDPAAELLEDLGLDSVDQLTLVVELENHFRICFDPGDEERIATLADVVALIGRRLAPDAAGGAGG